MSLGHRSRDWSSVDILTAHNPVRTEVGPPLPYYDITDRGHYADPNVSRLRAFVEARGGRIRELGIAIGAMIEGGDVQINQLGQEERDDLALLVAQKGVVCECEIPLLACADWQTSASSR